MRTAGAIRSENAGVSSARRVRIPSTVCLRVPGEGSSAQGESGPKMRPKGVVDGQQVEIPVLQYNRTVGTYEESMSREWKAACKRGRSPVGKTAGQSEGVMRTEI